MSFPFRSLFSRGRVGSWPRTHSFKFREKYASMITATSEETLSWMKDRRKIIFEFQLKWIKSKIVSVGSEIILFSNYIPITSSIRIGFNPIIEWSCSSSSWFSISSTQFLYNYYAQFNERNIIAKKMSQTNFVNKVWLVWFDAYLPGYTAI
jgi:hypothetical protein